MTECCLKALIFARFANQFLKNMVTFSLGKRNLIGLDHWLIFTSLSKCSGEGRDANPATFSRWGNDFV